MADVTMTQVSATLKEVYEDRIEKQYNTEMVFGKRIEKTSDGISDMIGGKYLDFPIQIARNPGISYRLEGEALGNPGATPYAEVHVPVYAGYGRVRFTGHVMTLAKTKPQAFANMAQREMETIKDSAIKDSSRIMYGDGTGRIATVTSGAGPAATITVGNAEGLWITPGMEIDILDFSTYAAVTNGTGRVVSLVTPGASNTVVTVTGAANITTTTSHAIFRAGNATSGTQREPTGLTKITDDSGILHTVDPSSYPIWKGVEQAMGGTLTEAAMGQVCDKIRINGGKVSAIFTGLGVNRAYFNVLKAGRQFHNTTEFDGGYKALGFFNGDEIPVVADIDAPPNTMFFVTEKQMSIRQAEEWKFVDIDGSIFDRVSGYDMYDVLLRKFWELATYARNQHGKLTGITEG